ncbi:Sua5/YciO/YrdC/YwlC family protein [Enterobacteriaceae endosymbiont of Neohaemonia nigricornis]|uniref:Sua5/YciO/YrdC/YwlC family protein n=1 Tax=Enterobacteriaceae endosymbiont of Neohaemonia nigricornis TaxID=2675792 RepID=UPI00144A1E1B|nr:Sua5/YciO/YrdC/YwlC family protein [Enterobacteriaceae endosymbiont of Neohaemonia nigricornis]QJC30441.1 L-threonylcarbamoyladenylate synthase type 1 TsaC [Enterobacteriaceae endosymbiont of Neohaemonia nigricornis]
MNINCFIRVLQLGEIIAYPTESVFGLGCDPDNKKAVYKLLSIKQRSVNKGLILVTGNYQQLLKYINIDILSIKQKQYILSTWPGMLTWTIPTSLYTPKWLTGQFQTIAVRVTNFYLIKQICNAFGKPIISTSANISGHKPCLTAKEVFDVFKTKIFIIKGNVGGYNPSEIKHSLTNQIIRKG